MIEDELIKANKIRSKITQIKSLLHYAGRTIGSEKDLYLKRAIGILYQMEFDYEQYLEALENKYKSSPPGLTIKAKKKGEEEQEIKKRDIFAENPFGAVSEKKESVEEADLFSSTSSKEEPVQTSNDELEVLEVQKSEMSDILLQQVIKAEALLELVKTESEEREMEITKEEHVCLIHRGKIAGVSYVCPKCMAMYCLKCAKTLHNQNEKCWACEEEIHV